MRQGIDRHRLRMGAILRVLLCGGMMLLLLSGRALAGAIPEEVERAVPKEAEEILGSGDFRGPGDFSRGIGRILRSMEGKLSGVLRERLRGVAAVLAAVLLCSAALSLSQGDRGASRACSAAGALCVTALTAGSLESLIGMGWETIRTLSRFARVLLPALAGAAALSGSVTTASFQQVTALFLADLLMRLLDELLMPLVYLYIGVLTAACALPESRLETLAAGLRKGITALLTGTVLCFTLYLSVTRVIGGTVDSAAVKTAKTALSAAVPVVGGVIAEASEAVLAGAGLLKSTLGVFGMLTILALSAWPFLQLGIQYLLYKAAAVLTAPAAQPSLCRLVDGLGDAFGIVLGMTGSCAFLLLTSVLTFMAAVSSL